MSEVVFKPISPRSGWVEYELETDKLSPPIFRCVLRPINSYDFMDEIRDGKGLKVGQAIVEGAINAVVEWDLESGGQRIECSEENKRLYLRELLAERVKGRGEGMLLGIAIVMDASNRETFLKN